MKKQIIDEGYITFLRDPGKKNAEWKALQVFGTNLAHREYTRSAPVGESNSCVENVFVLNQVLGHSRYIYSCFPNAFEAEEAACLIHNNLRSSRDSYGPENLKLKKFKITYTDSPVERK